MRPRQPGRWDWAVAVACMVGMVVVFLVLYGELVWRALTGGGR